MKIADRVNCGFEVYVVYVEVDLRRGIQSQDIVGCRAGQDNTFLLNCFYREISS